MELKNKNLLIVESPAKAKTINKILGPEFQVKASLGHIKDLPEDRLGVDIDRGFKPEYILIPGKEKIVKELRDSAQRASKVFIATDPDREGEAIAYHIFEEIKVPEDRVFRAVFNEITPNAVKSAIENPTKIDINKVYSQQARRILDRLVGYSLSPFLWKKVKGGLSAGRVQSVALKMVVDREKEILTFEPQQYWTILGKFTYKNSENVTLSANLYKYRGSLVIDRKENRFLIRDEKSAEKIKEELEILTYFLSKIERKRKKRNPPEPFKTATLQAQASSQLGFSPKKTMMLAQQLYEGIEINGTSIGLITYMRTDSTRVSDEAKAWAKKLIEKLFGKEYVGSVSQGKKTSVPIQDAHECIRPTYADRTPESVKPYLSKDQFALYQLIWERFIASQMAPAEIEQTTYIIRDSENIAEFRVTGSVIIFPGFLKIYKDEEIENDKILPALDERVKLDLTEIISEKHTTEPPARYTEATLVKALEEKGIGRPSTYATILSTIQEKNYVKKIKQKLYPTYLGFVVSDLLEEKFPELMDYNFTAKMEQDLDRISTKETEWEKVVEEFYRDFEEDLKKASSLSKINKPKEIKTTKKCEKCGKDMVIRWSKGQPFLACSGYPTCKNTKSLLNNKEERVSNKTLLENKFCPKCGANLVLRKGKKGEFLACSSYPNCKYTEPLKAEMSCPKCGGEIVKKQTKKGQVFWACSNYPKCRFTLPNEPYPLECPQCGAEYMLKIKNGDGDEYFLCQNSKCRYKMNNKKESFGTDPAQQKDVNPARSGRKQR